MMSSSSLSSATLQHIDSGRVEIRTKTLIGSGNFADVYEGVYIPQLDSSTKRIVAVKVARSKTDPRNSSDSRELDMSRELVNEARIMNSVKHRNIVECIGISRDLVPNIIMELCVGGSLESHLRASKNIKTVDCVQFMYEISSGMRYLEHRNVVHRDLATRNVLISANGVLKISDFGLSLASNSILPKDRDLTKAQIPIRWLSPETLIKQPEFSSKSDVWAFGTTVFEIFNHGEKIWPDENVKWIATQIRRASMPTPPSSMPALFQEFLFQYCWVKDVNERWDFARINALINHYQLISYRPPQAKFYSLHKRKHVVKVKENYTEQKLDKKAILVDFPKYEDKHVPLSKAIGCKCKNEAEQDAKLLKRVATPTPKSGMRKKKKHDVDDDFFSHRAVLSSVNTSSCKNTK